MTKEEKAIRNRLQELELDIETGNMLFWNVGNALMHICDEQVYRLTYPTFKEYLSKRWRMSSTTASRYITATITRANLLLNPELEKAIGDITTSISFYIALSKLTLEQQEKVLATLLATNAPLSAYQVQLLAGTQKDDNYYTDLNYKRTIAGIKKMVKDKDLKKFFTRAKKKYNIDIAEDFVTDMTLLIKKLKP